MHTMVQFSIAKHVTASFLSAGNVTQFKLFTFPMLVWSIAFLLIRTVCQRNRHLLMSSMQHFLSFIIIFCENKAKTHKKPQNPNPNTMTKIPGIKMTSFLRNHPLRIMFVTEKQAMKMNKLMVHTAFLTFL